jgi:GNAT superfamily N-acetyltransferase
VAAPQISIRSIEAQDVDALIEMICELADHEGEREFVTTTTSRLLETGFGNNPQWRGFIAEHKDQAIAYATYTEDFHIWSGAPRITIDDLYVRPESRRHGLGRKLMERVFALAKETGAFVSWTVQPDNSRAIAFYRQLGASYNDVGKCGWRAGA